MQESITIPNNIVSPTDIARLVREIESVDIFFRDAAIRQSGETNALPRLSKLMDQLVADNQLNLLQEPDRVRISSSLQKLHTSAPVMHISFSVDPPGPYVQKIVAWLRDNIHPQVLVTVGLQPNIGAGCIVRTTNKLFDFSLREYFTEKREFFITKLHDAISDTGTGAAAELAEAQAGVQTHAHVASEQRPITTDPTTSNNAPQNPVVATTSQSPDTQPATPMPAPLTEEQMEAPQ